MLLEATPPDPRGSAVPSRTTLATQSDPSNLFNTPCNVHRALLPSNPAHLREKAWFYLGSLNVRLHGIVDCTDTSKSTVAVVNHTFPLTPIAIPTW